MTATEQDLYTAGRKSGLSDHESYQRAVGEARETVVPKTTVPQVTCPKCKGEKGSTNQTGGFQEFSGSYPKWEQCTRCEGRGTVDAPHLPQRAEDTIEKQNGLWYSKAYPNSGWMNRGNALRYVYFRLLGFSLTAAVEGTVNSSPQPFPEDEALHLVQGVLDCKRRLSV